MSDGERLFLDLDLPELFDLEVPFDDSPTGWLVDCGRLTPSLFDRLDDGTYLLAGHGGRPIWIRAVEVLDGGVIRCLDGGGAEFLYRIRALRD